MATSSQRLCVWALLALVLISCPSASGIANTEAGVPCSDADLGPCTANDSGFHYIVAGGTPVCQGSDGFVQVSASFEINAENRYDYGVWLSDDPAVGLSGTCSVGIPPLTSAAPGATSTNFFVNTDDKKNADSTYDQCPDANKNFSPQSFVTEPLKVKCKPGNKLTVCFTYDNNKGNDCNSPRQTSAGTGSKCVCRDDKISSVYYSLTATMVPVSKCLLQSDSTVDFKLTVANTGTATAKDVVFNLALPNGWTVSGSSECTLVNGKYSCLGDVLPGATTTKTIRLVAPSTTASLTLTASSIAPRTPSSFIPAVTATASGTFSACPCSNPPNQLGCKNCATQQITVNGKADIVGTPISTVTVTGLAGCCSACADVADCSYYQYRVSTKQCVLLALANLGSTPCVATPADPDYKVGGKCNPNMKGDPHLVGAHHTAFDFNGRPGETYCLITDKEVQVNIAIEGYEGGSPLALRTWIKGMSFFWMAAGQPHSLKMAARNGPEEARGPQGFLLEAALDGQRLPRFEGDEPSTFSSPASGLTFRFLGLGKYGHEATERYQVTLGDALDLFIVLRTALPVLRTPSEAYVHFDLEVSRLRHSEDVHGVLGQTYRADRAERTAFYQGVLEKLKGPMHALEDGPGAGFLDGVLADYRTVALMDSKCPLSRFGGNIPLPTANWQAQMPEGSDGGLQTL